MPDGTLIHLLNSNFLQLQANHATCFPDLRRSHTLLLASDYSGESPDAPYIVYSFLITSTDAWRAWESERLSIRKLFLADSRRMSFKGLGDTQRRQALEPLLEAANRLEGLSFSVAISKRCGTIFSGRPPLDLGNPAFEAYAKWKIHVLEKAFTTVHFLSFLLAGLSFIGQDVFWFTDEDSIAANDQRVCELTQLFAWISSQYLTFNLGHCRCGTARCDDGSRQIEDLLAIPDLIAGALSEQLRLRETTEPSISNVYWMHRPDFTDKSKAITWWYSQADRPMKRLFCIVDPSFDGKRHTLYFFHFFDQL